MLVLSELQPCLQTLLTTQADALARETDFIQRQRVFSGGTFAQTLIFGWLQQPHATLEELAEVAAAVGASVSPQALDQRLTATASHFLARLLSQALQYAFAAAPVPLPLLQRFAAVWVMDSTSVPLPAEVRELFPGCGGSTPADGQAALKCHVALELSRGSLELLVGAGRYPDSSSPLVGPPLPEGSLRLADLGFFNLEALADYTDQGVYWLSRLPAHLKIADASGAQAAVAEYLAAYPGDRLDQEVWVGTQRLACRLVALRVPEAIAQRRRQRLRRRAQRKGNQVSAARLALCAWNIALTNACVELLRPEEIWALLRARWQIELLFKAWKSHGGLGHSRAQRGQRVLCETYAKLLAMLVQHGLVLVTVGSPLGWSYPKLARRVRRQAGSLLLAVHLPEQFTRLLEGLRQTLGKRCRVPQRTTHPSTFQVLLQPQHADWQWLSSPDPEVNAA